MNSDLAVYSNVLENKVCPRYTSPVNPAELAEKQQKVQPLVDKISKLIADNPDFVSQYGSEEKAVLELTRYSVSHNVRYSIFTDVKINKGSSWAPDYIKVQELSGEKLAEAEQSLIDNIRPSFVKLNSKLVPVLDELENKYLIKKKYNG